MIQCNFKDSFAQFWHISHQCYKKANRSLNIEGRYLSNYVGLVNHGFVIQRKK